MRCKHSGRQQIKIGLSTILSVWFNLELQIFSEWLFISSTGGFNVKVGVKKTAWKRNQGNIVVVFFRLLQRKDLVLCVCPTCVSLNHHYLMCTNGYHFTFICYTPQWEESFFPKTSVAIVILFWLIWAGYLAVAGLNLLAQLSDRISPSGV